MMITLIGNCCKFKVIACLFCFCLGRIGFYTISIVQSEKEQ